VAGSWPAIHGFAVVEKTWMAGPSPAMTMKEKQE
jgi:hypothetical protein